jgi:hypothetical protein
MADEQIILIQKLLLHEWDAAKVKRLDANHPSRLLAEDEYKGYAQHTHRLLLNHASAHTIEKYLMEAALWHMRVRFSPFLRMKTRRVAKLIMELPQQKAFKQVA